jgi:acyl dehydratase
MKINDSYIEYFSVNQDQVLAFSEITGDENPIHLDLEYAKNSIFKTVIVHGFLSGSIFSKIIGMYFPGERSVYLEQKLRFCIQCLLILIILLP